MSDGDASLLATVFPGDGVMATRCRALDWSATPLGPVAGWSVSLRTTTGIVLASRQPMFLFWGPELVQLYNDAYAPSLGTGGRADHALGARGRAFWTDVWADIGPQIAQVMTTGEATWHEDQHLPIERNGRLEDVWWTYSYGPVRDDDGTIAATLVVCQETTGRVLADRALQDAHRALDVERGRLAQVFRQSPSFVAVLRGSENVFEFVNDAYEQMIGRGRGIVGQALFDALPEARGQGFDAYLQRVRETGEPLVFRDLPVRLDRAPSAPGEQRFVDITYLPLVEADGTHDAVIAHGADVTEQVRARRDFERVLAEREEARRAALAAEMRLHALFAQAPVSMIVTEGPDHLITLANERATSFAGRRDLVGQTYVAAYPELADSLVRTLDRVYATGTAVVTHESRVVLAGDEIFLDLVFQPLRDPGKDGAPGPVTGILHFAADVTVQAQARQAVAAVNAQLQDRQMELELANQQLQENAAELEMQAEELQVTGAQREERTAAAEVARREAESARREAEGANRAKAEFLATMSHELRTPLNAIGGYAELLEMGIRGPVTAQQAEDLRRIQSSQRHLLGLVNEVLDLARVDAGELRVERAAVRAGDTVDAALALVRPQAAAKSLDLSEACQGAADRPYLGDEPRVRQVLVNLLANAIKFTPAGGRVTVECIVTDATPAGRALVAGLPYLALRVVDTGVGIPPEQRELIFEPFTQVGGMGPYTRPTGGTGLGLTISRRLARAMGGDLTVESEEGAGSTFTLWLPLPERRGLGRETPAGQSGISSAPSTAAADVAADLVRIGSALAAEADSAIRAWVARLRTDPEIPVAGRTDSELEDHVATFVTDIGLALRTLGETGAAPAELLRDSRAILAVVSERHGAQRVRLGWSEGAVVRELALLRDLLDAAVVRIAGPTGAASERARTALTQLFTQAERVSLDGYRVGSGRR